ncbi:MAG: biotin synthase BioB [bacterium]|jgi:biotin synthase
MVVENLSMPVISVQREPTAIFLDRLTRQILDERYLITREEACRIAEIPESDALLLFHHAHKIRQHFRSDTIGLCSIVNAKSGACSEDCSFCAQSKFFKTASPAYGLMKYEDVLQYARQAEQDGAEHIGIVISGYGIESDEELRAIGEICKRLKQEVSIEVHASVGIISREYVQYLKDCGVTMINHNLETSERFYPEVCTTHTWQERMETLKHVQECGMKMCTGGIFGMGETIEDRLDLAFTLRELNPDTVPLNFLHAIDGTPLENTEPLPPVQILMIIALFRFILPTAEIKICGGREKNLRDLQSMIFFAGADSMMIGNYLTTAGRNPELDWQMLKDLGLNWARK